MARIRASAVKGQTQVCLNFFNLAPVDVVVADEKNGGEERSLDDGDRSAKASRGGKWQDLMPTARRLIRWPIYCAITVCYRAVSTASRWPLSAGVNSGLPSPVCVTYVRAHFLITRGNWRALPRFRHTFARWMSRFSTGRHFVRTAFEKLARFQLWSI